MSDRNRDAALKIAPDWNQNPGSVPQSFTQLMLKAQQNCPCVSPAREACQNLRICKELTLACPDFQNFASYGKYRNEDREPSRRIFDRVFSRADSPIRQLNAVKQGEVGTCVTCGIQRAIKARGMCQSCYHHAPKRKKATAK